MRNFFILADGYFTLLDLIPQKEYGNVVEGGMNLYKKSVNHIDGIINIPLQIEQLAELKNDGFLTDSELEKLKKRLLKENLEGLIEQLEKLAKFKKDAILEDDEFVSLKNEMINKTYKY